MTRLLRGVIVSATGSGPNWEHLSPVDDFRQSSQAVQSIGWTNWPRFTVGMMQRGHSDETIRKILGEHTLSRNHAVQSR